MRAVGDSAIEAESGSPLGQQRQDSLLLYLDELINLTIPLALIFSLDDYQFLRPRPAVTMILKSHHDVPNY